MKNFVFPILGVVAVCLSGCSKESSRTMQVRIAPTITRVTGVHFDRDDRIGLTISRNSVPFVNNAMMTYDGSVFAASGLVWYNDLNQKSTLTAYYPYSELGQPSEFTIAADQTAGCTSSDLLAAAKKDVTPAASAVGMLFHHLLSQVTVVVTNTSQGNVESVSLSGFVPTAGVDYVNLKATVKSGEAAAEVHALEVTAGAAYRVVLVPQQGALTVTVRTDDGKSHSVTLPDALLEGGRKYDMPVTVTDVDIDVSLSGDIEDWTDGGTLGENNAGNDAPLSYQGVEYRTQTIGGKRWMAENLRYVPGGVVNQNGIWYPCRSNEACSEAAYIEERGMLYDYATASGGVSAKSRGVAVQGICPAGWHIPTADELNLLLGSDYDPSAFFALAGFWNKNLGSYLDETRGYLMGTLSADGKTFSSLKIVKNNAPAAATQDAGCGVSLRCVQD